MLILGNAHAEDLVGMVISGEHTIQFLSSLLAVIHLEIYR